MNEYLSDPAFKKALEARIRANAENLEIDANRERRRLILEILMARLELGSPNQWTFKGGSVMELRLGNQARFTKDLDIVTSKSTVSDITEALTAATDQNPRNDRFRFEVGRPVELDAMVTDNAGWRFSVEAFLAGKRFETVSLDVVSDATGQNLESEHLLLPDRLSFAGIEPVAISVVSREQHFAEKLHAYCRHYRNDRPSSRVRDLPDTLLLIQNGLEPSKHLLNVVRRLFEQRGVVTVPTTLPKHLHAPWPKVYPRLAEETGLSSKTLAQAQDRLAEFWDAALAQSDQ